ncbi:MAG: lactate utilization protein [Phycisphaerae bacterium]|nr:lactate utilization protein [Phycisphaerae bacterium]
MWSFERVSREKVADLALADKLHNATATSLEKSNALVAETPNWQELRQRARRIKLHTLTHLDQYLRRFAEAAEAHGATVSWADTGEDACRRIVELARRHGVTRATKAKSMTGEEIEINKALERAGVEPVETDLGEMICQLAGERPSHVTAPIIQWSMEEVARQFKASGVIDEIPAELEDRSSAEQAKRIAIAAQLTDAARRALREKFMTAGMGISGANFAVAQSGTLVLVENEANIRLTTTLPRLHVAVVGIDKVIPTLDDLCTFLTLLPVAATGQRQSGYVSLIHRPYGELHIILLDNGRTDILADKQHHDLLSCIRCGACMNVCPVYRHVSGHGYDSIYPGPIGAVLTPHLRREEHLKQLPFASSLCGACSEVCPVAIPLHERLLQWRDRIVRQGGRPTTEAMAFSAWAWLMRHPGLYRTARPPAGCIDVLAGLVSPGRRWKAARDLPGLSNETFADWWKKNRDAPEA